MMIVQARLIADDIPPEWLVDSRYRFGAEREPEKRCWTCRRHFAATEEFFYRNKTHDDQLDGTCKACRRARAAEIREQKRRQFA